MDGTLLSFLHCEHSKGTQGEREKNRGDRGCGGSARAAAAAAVGALKGLSLVPFALGHTANTGCGKVGIPRLSAPQAAQIIKPGLCNK